MLFLKNLLMFVKTIKNYSSVEYMLEKIKWLFFGFIYYDILIFYCLSILIGLSVIVFFFLEIFMLFYLKKQSQINTDIYNKNF